MKVARDRSELEDGLARRPRRGPRGVRQRRGLSGEIPRPAAPYRAAGAGRRCTATWCISASATAACSAATRSCWRRPVRRRSSPAERDALGATRHRGAARPRLPQRRHARVPLPGRPVRLHRDEHAAAGRAPGDRDGRAASTWCASRSASPPATRSATARPTSASPATRSSAASTPRTRSPSPPRPAASTAFHAPGRARRAGRFRALRRLRRAALLRQHGRQADRARADPRRRRSPGCAARWTSSRWSASRPRCRCISASSTSADFKAGDYTSTGWNTSSPGSPEAAPTPPRPRAAPRTSP